MITPSGSIQTSQKNKSHKGQISKKKRAKLEKGREKAAELSGKLEVKVREREDRKVSFVSNFADEALTSMNRPRDRERRRLGSRFSTIMIMIRRQP